MSLRTNAAADVPPPALHPPAQAPQITREVTVTPSMCGQSSLLAARIGDWSWETVSRQCGLDVQKATTRAGEPAYLSFYYIRIRGSEHAHPLGLGFGDRLTVDSRAFDVGSESVLTLHRLAPVEGSPGPPAVLEPEEFHRRPRPDCLYAETFNRWISRPDGGGNAGLVSAAPPDFDHRSLPRLPHAYSPRSLTTAARKNASLLPLPSPGLLPRFAPFVTDHVIDPVRDLNAVGLVYFAAYFSIVDTAVLGYWRHVGRSDRSFLRRRVLDQKLCYFGNADHGSTLRLALRAYSHEGSPCEETLDITAVEQSTGRLLAVCAIRLLRDAEASVDDI